VPVLFETADENAGEALVELMLVGDRGRAGCLSVHAGIEPFKLAPAEALGPRSVLAERLADLDGVEEAYLFGSWARRYQGEPGPPPGDIDVVVIGQPDVDAVYDACREASAILGQEVNPVVLSPAEWRTNRSGFVQELHKGTLVALTGG
jgi:predicted nucleotidyltransferase